MEIYWSVHLSDETYISSTKLFCAYRTHNGCDARFVRRIFGIHIQRRDFRQIFEYKIGHGCTAPSTEAMLRVDAAIYIQHYEEDEWNLTKVREEGGKRKLNSSSLSTVDTKLVRIFSSVKYRLIYITFYLYTLGTIRASLSAQFRSLIEPCRYTVGSFFCCARTESVANRQNEMKINNKHIINIFLICFSLFTCFVSTFTGIFARCTDGKQKPRQSSLMFRYIYVFHRFVLYVIFHFFVLRNHPIGERTKPLLAALAQRMAAVFSHCN